MLRQNKSKSPLIAVGCPPPIFSPKCGDKIHEVYDLMQSGREQERSTSLCPSPQPSAGSRGNYALLGGSYQC